MATDRIRLSERARKRLFALADQADLEPSFLLEYLINRHGKESIQTLSGQQGSLVSLTSTNEPCQGLTPSSVSLTSTNPTADPKGNLSQQQHLAKWLESDD